MSDKIADRASFALGNFPASVDAKATQPIIYEDVVGWGHRPSLGAFKRSLEKIDLKKNIFLTWSSPFRPYKNPDLSLVRDYFCLGLETPLIGRNVWVDEIKPGLIMNKENWYCRIGSPDPTTLYSDFNLPKHPNSSRYFEILKKTGNVLKGMKQDSGKGHLIYVVQVPRDASQQGLNTLQQAVYDLWRISKYTRRKVLLSMHPDCFNEKWASARLEAHEDSFQYLKRIVALLNYEFIPFGINSSHYFDGCDVVITQSSGTGYEALEAGVPVIATQSSSFVYPLCPHDLAALESSVKINPKMRDKWFYKLAYAQWSFAELENGTASEHWRPVLEAGETSPASAQGSVYDC